MLLWEMKNALRLECIFYIYRVKIIIFLHNQKKCSTFVGGKGNPTEWHRGDGAKTYLI